MATTKQIDDDARQEAQNAGLDIETVKGTGPEGRVTLQDVRAVQDKQRMEQGKQQNS